MIDGIPVIDAVIHPYNFAEENCATDFAKSLIGIVYWSIDAFAADGYRPAYDDFVRDWSMQDTTNMVFAESSTDLACNHVLPIFAFKDGLCSLDKAIEAQERWPQRIVSYCGVDPMQGERAIEEIDRQLETLDAVGLKLYPNSFVGEKINGWKMDDPEIAFPVFEHARKRGLRTIGIHKAVPLGAVPGEYYKVDDVDRAATAFPDINFEIVHGGMAFVEETAWQIARFPNVYVNLETTTSLLGKRPGSFQRALATLLDVAGEAAIDKICWGTGCVAFHPQPLLERFVREFQFDDDLVDRYGIPQLTLDHKRKILAENYAAMCGFDLSERMAAIVGDEFEQQTQEALRPPFSTAAPVAHAS
jgi:predicted TIM-barrel fold metal-dependent hydrolase